MELFLYYTQEASIEKYLNYKSTQQHIPNPYLTPNTHTTPITQVTVAAGLDPFPHSSIGACLLVRLPTCGRGLTSLQPLPLQWPR